MDLQKRKTWQVLKTESLSLALPLYFLCDLRKNHILSLASLFLHVNKIEFCVISLWWESS